MFHGIVNVDLTVKNSSNQKWNKYLYRILRSKIRHIEFATISVKGKNIELFFGV